MVPKMDRIVFFCSSVFLTCISILFPFALLESRFGDRSQLQEDFKKNGFAQLARQHIPLSEEAIATELKLIILGRIIDREDIER